MIKPLFQLGQVVATPAALEVMEAAGIHPAVLLERHQTGDWGDMCEEDKKHNDLALSTGEERIFSSYNMPTKSGVPPDSRIWVITEWDHSVTTLLLPEDY